jgi:hypothetical protein
MEGCFIPGRVAGDTPIAIDGRGSYFVVMQGCYNVEERIEKIIQEEYSGRMNPCQP